MGDSHGQAFRQELTSCQHFLVDSKLVRDRHYILNFASKNVTSKIKAEKFQEISKSLHCAAEDNLALGFVLRNV